MCEWLWIRCLEVCVHGCLYPCNCSSLVRCGCRSCQLWEGLGSDPDFCLGLLFYPGPVPVGLCWTAVLRWQASSAGGCLGVWHLCWEVREICLGKILCRNPNSTKFYPSPCYHSRDTRARFVSRTCKWTPLQQDRAPWCHMAGRKWLSKRCAEIPFVR